MSLILWSPTSSNTSEISFRIWWQGGGREHSHCCPFCWVCGWDSADIGDSKGFSTASRSLVGRFVGVSKGFRYSYTIYMIYHIYTWCVYNMCIYSTKGFSMVFPWPSEKPSKTSPWSSLCFRSVAFVNSAYKQTCGSKTFGIYFLGKTIDRVHSMMWYYMISDDIWKMIIYIYI